ncbi:MAG: lysophospholipid acyltransferase family protein [bacterium]
MRRLLFVLRFTLFGLATLARFTLALIRVKLSGDPTTGERWLLRAFGLRGVRICGGDIGLPRELPPLDDRPYIVVANHKSHLDVPLIVSGLPELRLRFVGKPALFRLPIFGHYLRAAGHLEARRLPEVLDACRTLLARGHDVMFFPEGTRTPGPLGPQPAPSNSPSPPAAPSSPRPLWHRPRPPQRRQPPPPGPLPRRPPPP